MLSFTDFKSYSFFWRQLAGLSGECDFQWVHWYAADYAIGRCGDHGLTINAEDGRADRSFVTVKRDKLGACGHVPDASRAVV